MSRFKDLTGKYFGDLTVIKRESNYNHGGTRYLCVCVCGNEKIIASKSLINGTAKNCGCKRGVDKSGTKIGKLSILKRVSFNKFECLCDCSKTVIMNFARINIMKSCGCDKLEKKNATMHTPKDEFIYNQCIICGTTFKGCYKKENTCSKHCSDVKRQNYLTEYRKNKRYKNLEYNITSVVKNIIARAKYDGYKTDITVEYVLEVVKNQNNKCAMTGIEFSLPDSNEKNPWSVSVDKINPKIGYFKNNVQIVCLMYNYCKHTFSNETVLEFAKALVSESEKQKLTKG